MKKILFVLLASCVGFSANLDITTLSAVQNENIKSIIEFFALGADYKAVHYATPEGLLLGLDLGIETTAIQLPAKTKDALTLMGNSTANVPSMIPLPRLNITKGLPFGFDLGASLFKMKVRGIDILNYGGSLKFAFFDGGVIMPAVAIRGTFNKGKYFNRIKTQTLGIELLVSKNLIILEPFGGIGYQSGKGEIDSTGIALPTAITLDTKQTVSQVRAFVGATLKLGFLNLAAEADFGKIQTYSGKLSLNF